MASGKFASMRNLEFLLYEVGDVESLTSFSYFEDHSREVFDLVLETGMKMAEEQLYPALSQMDREQPEFEDGVVTVLPLVRDLMKECGEGGWIGAHASYDLGGQQLPNSVMVAVRFLLSAANYSASVYPFLSSGAAQLLISFASKELVDTYVPKMFGGEWQGTMALTEPQAGSSLTDVATTATRTDDGHYLLKGQKIFISCGEHDAVDNIVHLLLARVEGAPAGVKGISMFVVPKHRPTDGSGTEPNDLVCTGIFHKLGYRGSPITQLELGEHGDCRGWLVGEENRGLSYMFQMMNEARVDVGAGATAIATAAYYASLDYAMERPQGRKVSAKDPSTPQVPIIEHADVKRMLLFQRSIVEGSLSLIVECAKLSDLSHVAEGEVKARADLLLEILTPVAKSYPSEMGILSTSAGLQCLGGYGYCDEFPLEQYYRDVRIHPIHEGTTGIQGMDLLGRKVVMQNGAAFMAWLEAVNDAIAAAQNAGGLESQANALADAVEELKSVTAHLTGLAMEGKIELFLADATLYLEYFGIVTIAWQWLKQATVAKQALAKDTAESDVAFYEGKLYTCRYFFSYELPKTAGLAKRLLESDGLTVEAGSEHFVD